MSEFNRGPAPRRSGSADPKPVVKPSIAVSSRPRTFALTKADSILLESCKKIGGVVVCGGWVRDKILGLKPKDYDLIVSHEKFESFNDKLSRQIQKRAAKNGFKFVDLSEPKPKATKPKMAQLRCGLDMTSYKFRLTNTTTGETTDMEIDAKQLYPGQDFTSDIDRRDFSANCLLYYPSQDQVICRPTDYLHLVQKKLHHAVQVEETMKDPVRFLRAFRLKHEKGLHFSKELESYLRIDRGQKFSGCHFRTIPQHARKATPLEYKKIISQPSIFPACMTEIYEYGYIFKWRSEGSPTQMVSRISRLRHGLQMNFYYHVARLSSWAGWQNVHDREYLTKAFLLALAIFDLDKSPAAEKQLDFVENTQFYMLFTAFVPEEDRSPLIELLSKLAEDYKQGVAELSGLREYRRAFNIGLDFVPFQPPRPTWGMRQTHMDYSDSEDEEKDSDRYGSFQEDDSCLQDSEGEEEMFFPDNEDDERQIW